MIDDKSTSHSVSVTIKVANIIEEGRYGGPQNRIVSVAQRLKDKGIETIVILPSMGSEHFVEHLRQARVEHKVMKLTRLSRTLGGNLKFLFSFPFDVLKIRRVLKNSGVQLVHCNGSWQWKGAIAGKLLGLKIVWHLNDTSMPGSIHKIFNLIANWSASSFIVAARRVESYYLKDKFANRQRFLIPAPVDCQSFIPSSKERQAENQKRPVNIVSIGNINPLKDVETFVRMALYVRKKSQRKVNFIQIGAEFETQKAYVSQVRQLNKTENGEAVDFVGEQKDVLSFLQQADIYVCASRFEASPISVWEAMAAGLPIVSTDVGDIARMNEEGSFAKVVPTGDFEALANSVMELINSPAERRRLGANARQYAIENLDINICACKHAEAYRAILSNQKGKE